MARPGPASGRPTAGRGSGTCTCSPPSSPTWTGAGPAVREDFDAVLRFWLDRGVDGLRVDAAPAMAKVPGLPDAGHGPGARFESRTWVGNPHWDVDGVHDILRRWRAIGDTYDGDRLFVTEAVVRDPERLSRYVAPGRDAHQLQLRLPHRAVGAAPAAAGHRREHRGPRPGRRAADLGAVQPRRDPARDPVRPRRERGRDDGVRHRAPAHRPGRWACAAPARPRCSPWRCPGSAYLYQGEELGLPEVEDLPEEALQDPTWERSGHQARGRDGCRVPLPWAGDRPPFGFTADGVAPWLPQPADWGPLTMAAQRADPDSTLSLYRSALHLRRELRALHEAPLTWQDVRRRRPGVRPGAVLPLRREPLAPAGPARRAGPRAARQRAVLRRSAPRHRRLAGDRRGAG